MKILDSIKALFLPYQPLKIGADVWSEQFSSGHWKYLGDLKQIARYSIIVGVFDYLYKGEGKILDLGCGNAVLFERLKKFNFKEYIGIDISHAAISEGNKIIDNRAKLICAEIDNYLPETKFEMIVFNESLYYLDEPIKTLNYYFKYLTQDGVIVISMWDYKLRNNKLWKFIDSKFILVDELNIQKPLKKSGWIIKVIKQPN
ncbi:MAG: methyltransferase domain-containing protein [Ignavibacteriaceae bacterium]